MRFRAIGSARSTIRSAGRLLAAALLLALLRAAPGRAAEAPVDAGLVARAKAEGAVVFYGAMQQPQLAAVSRRFEQRYGIKVGALRLPSDKLPARVLTEARGGRPLADVLLDGAYELEELRNAGALEAYLTPETRAFIPHTFDPQGNWAAFFLDSNVIAYDPARVRGAGIAPPATLEDFTKPAWRGKFGLFGTAYDWYIGLDHFYGPAAARALLEGYAANQPLMLAGHALGVTEILSGEILASANVYGYAVAQAMDDGRSITLVNPTPTVIDLISTAIVRDAPHPNAARLFERWLLSQETQQWMRTTMRRISPRRDVQNDPRLFNARVRYVVNFPVGAPLYRAHEEDFKAIFHIPG